MSVERFMFQTITLKRKTNTANTKGEQIPTWTTQTTFKGCIRVMSSREAFMRDKIEMNVSHVMFYQSTTPKSNDRIYFNSEEYLIKSIDNKSTGYPGGITYRKAYLERLEVLV